jgi:hypothetical protein
MAKRDNHLGFAGSRRIYVIMYIYVYRQLAARKHFYTRMYIHRILYSRQYAVGEELHIKETKVQENIHTRALC